MMYGKSDAGQPSLRRPPAGRPRRLAPLLIEPYMTYAPTTNLRSRGLCSACTTEATLTPVATLATERGAHALACTLLLVATEPAARASLLPDGTARATSRLLQRGGHDVRGQVQELSEVLNARVSQEEIVPLPAGATSGNTR